MVAHSADHWLVRYHDWLGQLRSAGRGRSCSRRKGDKRPGAASRLLHRVAREAGVTGPSSPHTLRRTFCTAGPISCAPRDMQYAMRHADARTTICYDMARTNIDRHAVHSVAAYLAGMAIG